MDVIINSKVKQWSLYIPMAGSPTGFYQLCTGYTAESLMGVIMSMLAHGMVGPGEFRVEVIREP